MLVTILILVVVLVVGPWLLSLKTSRPDGVHLSKIHPYRHMMQYIMPTRNESYVLYDDYVHADKLMAYLAEAKKHFPCDVTHALVAACAVALHDTPEMNHFISGRRLYRRKGRFLTFSMKRKQMKKKAKLSAVKLQMQHGETFRELCERIDGNVNRERSGEKTYADKELGSLSRIPRPFLNFGVWVLRTLDYYGLLPKVFLDGEAMYTSIFIANLGSVGMRAGYHHLYEWGNAPLFMMVGKAEARPIVEDGELKIVNVIPIRWTYDERIDDGLTSSYGMLAANEVLNNPFEHLGCLKEDGSDHKPLTTGPEE